MGLALHLLTLTLGVFFVFVGHLHITGQFFPDIHNQIKNEYGKFNKEFPLHRQTGWRPYAKNYRLTIGITEVISGFLLLLGFSQTLATIVLLGVMTNAIITFQKLNYSIEYLGSAIFLSFLLVLQLVFISKSKVKSTKKTNEKKTK